MIEETQRINHKKAEELEKQKKERELMTIEEILSKALNDLIKISELQSFYAREHKNIIKEDDFSLKLRDLVPYLKKKYLWLTESSSYPEIKIIHSTNEKKLIIIPKVPQKPVSVPILSQSFHSLPLPKLIKVSKIPGFTEDSDVELPTLSNFLPYPLDPTSKSLEVKHEDIKSISGLKDFKNLQVLVLSLNKITKVSNLPGSLIHLDLSQNLLTSISELNLPCLEELILDLNRISSITGLTNCVNLRILSMNNNKITKVTGLEKCGLLERLLLYRNKIQEIDSKTFDTNPYIIHLDLGRNELKTVHFLYSLRLLKGLIIYHNQISEIQPLSLPILQELWVNGNTLKILDFLKDTPLLETLRIEDNSISSVSSYNCHLLKHLNISFNNISSFAEVLNCITNSRSLTNFSFNDNPLLATHPDLLPLYNEIIVKALPAIQELNNTPRTSNSLLVLNKASLARRSFELHQIDLYGQRQKRNNEIIKYVPKEFKILLFQLPSVIYSQISTKLEFSFKGLEYFWYQAKKVLYKETKAALVIQTW